MPVSFILDKVQEDRPATAGPRQMVFDARRLLLAVRGRRVNFQLAGRLSARS